MSSLSFALPSLQEVVERVAAVVGHDSVTADQNFLDVGGNSLCAVEVVARLQETYGVQVDPGLLFDSYDIAEFHAAFLAAAAVRTGMGVP